MNTARYLAIGLLVLVLASCSSESTEQNPGGEGEGEGAAQGEGEGEGAAQGEGEGEGAAQGEGEGEGAAQGEGEGEGAAQGEGEGEGAVEGEGEGEGAVEGEGEGEGAVEGEGEGEGAVEGEGEGEGAVEGEGEGEGAVEGEGEGEGEGVAEGEGEGAPPEVGLPGWPCQADGSCQQGDCTTLTDGREVCRADCLSNADCSDQRVRCEAISADEMICLAGPRGAGAFGSSCADTGNDCASALCLDADPQFGRPDGLCTDVCEISEDCAAPLPFCLFYFGSGICLPVPTGVTGGLCHVAPPQCDEDADECLGFEEQGDRCTRACAVDEDCTTVQPFLRCRDTAQGKYCLLANDAE